MTIAEMNFDNEKLLVLGWFIDNFGTPLVGNIEDSVRREMFIFKIRDKNYYAVEFTKKLFSISIVEVENINSLFGEITVPKAIETLATFRSLS